MGNTKFDASWTLSEAVVFLQVLIQPLADHGFGVGLTGSVVTKGLSKHDLDIVIYPLQSTASSNIADAKYALELLGMKCHLDADAVKSAWRRKGSLDEKKVEVWHYNKKRVDVFFLK